ncbi:hypothetical protein ASF49_20580 [Methylobacterium sp. Leaf104]|uniref:hypothetical protein n=1 Tax=Methylobacterium TaxID=407 RepID=UPI0006F7B988|nr:MULTISPECIES: hypothetical protein [Methylobacterium]KQP40610.1 hypothetical protein ASF49_20580 [Methylobacterium sp. Leaf104]MCI9882733.1 hypothetical protein [Methylobacterium goesingense]
MVSRFLVSLLATGIGFAATAAAAKDVPFAKVKDWEISRSGEGDKAKCLMARGYQDPDDENASSVVVATSPGFLILSLGYQGWSHDKGDRTVVLLAGGKVVLPRSKWKADETQLTGEFPDTLLPHLLGADALVLRFKDGDADFKIPAFAEAFEALKRCNGDTAPVATEIPSEGRIANYASGLYFQKALTDCEVASTGKQRADLDAKLAGMRPEMSPIQALIDIELAKRFSDPKEPFCPKPADAAAFGTALDQYLVLPPEAFAAETARRQEKKNAAARPSETRIKVYGMGLIFQKLLGSCEIPTTARQRAAFDAKLAALAPEMTTVLDEVQGKLQPTLTKPVAELCGAFRDLSEDPQPIVAFSTQTPEDFAGFMDAREAAKSAAKAADTPVPGAKL